MKPRITQRQLAELLDESQPAIEKHVRLGHVKLNPDLLDAVVQLYKHAREVAAGRQPENGPVDRMLEAALLDCAKREDFETRLAAPSAASSCPYSFSWGTQRRRSARGERKLLAGPSKIRTQFPDLAPDKEQHSHDVLTELSMDSLEIFENALKRSLSAFKPHRGKTVCEWADSNRKLSSESSPETGKWRTRVE